MELPTLTEEDLRASARVLSQEGVTLKQTEAAEVNYGRGGGRFYCKAPSVPPRGLLPLAMRIALIYAGF